MKKLIWIIFVLIISFFGSMNCFAADPIDKPWTIYEMKLVQVRDMEGEPWVYVIGFSAFHTVEALKAWVAQIPEGNTLKWDDGSDLPITGDPLGSAQAAEDFVRFCEARKINLERVIRP